MALTHIEHVLIQTADMEATRDFYTRVLGFRVGPHPDFKFPVMWLYLGERDVIHVTAGGADTSENRRRYVGQQSDAVNGTGVIDHIAFHGTDLKGTLEHLEREGVPFNHRMADDQGLFQLFMMDPNGIKVELSFANTEVGDIKPHLMASSLPG